MLLPCEIDQAKTRSHLTTGMFNQFVKDPYGLIRLSGVPLDRGPDCYVRVSPNLMRLPISAVLQQFPAFLRNLSNLLSFYLSVKVNLSIRLYLESPKGRKAQNIKD